LLSKFVVNFKLRRHTAALDAIDRSILTLQMEQLSLARPPGSLTSSRPTDQRGRALQVGPRLTPS